MRKVLERILKKMESKSKYKIQSVIISPDAWIFEATTATAISPTLSFKASNVHGDHRHIISYECTAKNIDEAWKMFHIEATNFIEAVVFYTSSYIAFHDWNNIVINKTKNTALVSLFDRTSGTPLGIESQDGFDEIQKIIILAKSDARFKKFLHCYRMALLVDAPETQDAYEKYLILASEALAGEVDNGKGYLKVDHTQLKTIIGKPLHDYFFSSIDPIAGKTIRNANMHDGKSPNQKSNETTKLVNKLREYIAKEYGLNDLKIIKEEHSPTRGLSRDDGSMMVVGGKKLTELLDLREIRNMDEFIKKTSNNTTLTYYGNDKARRIYSKM